VPSTSSQRSARTRGDDACTCPPLTVGGLLRRQSGRALLSCSLGLDGLTFAHDYFLLKR